jgi:hypothetical protein
MIVGQRAAVLCGCAAAEVVEVVVGVDAQCADRGVALVRLQDAFGAVDVVLLRCPTAGQAANTAMKSRLLGWR